MNGLFPSTGVAQLLTYTYGFIATCSATGFIHPKLRRPEARPVRDAINSWWPSALIGGAAVAGCRALGISYASAVGVGVAALGLAAIPLVLASAKLQREVPTSESSPA